jgi:hypothetical protein
VRLIGYQAERLACGRRRHRNGRSDLVITS